MEGTLTVTQIPATVTAENKSRFYKAENPELTYTITDAEGAAIEIPGIPELSTTAALESSVGEYPITVAQGTLNNNYSYTFVEGTLTVTQAPATVTAENKSRPYNSENPELTYTVKDSSGTVITVSGSAELTTTADKSSKVGEYPITVAQGTLNNNYSYTFVEGTLTVTQAPATVTAENKSRPYNSENPELTYTVKDSEGAVITVSGSAELTTTADKSSKVGEYPITVAQGTLDNNYSYTLVNGTLTVTQASATVTAENKSRPYNAENPELTYTVKDSDGAVITVSGAAELTTTADKSSKVGEYPITVAQGTLNNNYSYTFVEGTLTITQAPATVTADNKTRPYNTENPELTYTVKDSSGTVITVSGAEIATTADKSSKVGEYPITVAQGTLDNNYSYTFVEGTLTVTQAPATVTADDKKRLYYAENPKLTYTIRDTEGALIEIPGTPELNTTAVLESSVGEYPITVAQGTLDSNYSYTFVNGTLTIAELPETVTIEPLTFTLIEGTINYSITDCNDNYSGELILPSMIPIEGTDYPVTEIEEWAFYACIRLSSVVIPEGITQIGRGAFSNCLGLSSVTLPEGLLQIGESSFASCSSLSEITIPESVTSIGNWAFRYCSNLSQVNIPNSITEIGDQTFRFCEALTSVTIPPSVTKIGAWAFAGCTSLKETNIGENVITIGEHAFSDCSSLAQVVVPDSTEEIAAWAFASCTSLKEIIIGENVTSIGDYAFSNCSSLTKMDIPDSVTTLGAGVFASCTSLKEIIVGNSVNSIGSEAFAYCDSTIYFKSDTPPEVGDNIFLDCPADMLICYPAGSEDNWGPEWQGFATQAWDPTSNPTPEEPSLTCGTVTRNPETGEISFTLNFTGTLQESADGITWSDVSDAAEATYTVTVQKNQNRFFRAVVK